MLGTLRGGLSLGLCGFSFRSHFIGGFPYATPEDLYRRWLAFGVLTSHSRCHGSPPTEPWEYDEEFTGDFRRTVELKYQPMPYVYAQAALASREGHPMLRTLFFEHPEDGGLHVLRLAREGDGFDLGEDPLEGRVNWTISTAP